MSRLNPEFSNTLKKFGAFDTSLCYNCGNCTAICSLSDELNSFPRMMVRASVIGLEDKIKGSLDPWLCYYCGECSTTCPRQANPGELMMSLRRWLTSKYDWTGLSGLLYKFLPLTILAFILTAAAVFFFSAYNAPDQETIMHFGHQFEMIAIAGVFGFILLPNIIRMWYMVIGKQKAKIPLVRYLKAMRDLIVHMFTQKRTLGCDDSQTRWFAHLVLVLGYLALLFTTVVLDWFGTNNQFIIALGYIESAAIFLFTLIFMGGRIRKNKEVNKFSQPSDWFFVIWLFLMGFTAFLVRLFIDTGLIETHFWMYIVHLIVLVQWAVIIVPFGKWTHFLYRSFAMYFQKVKEPTVNY